VREATSLCAAIAALLLLFNSRTSAQDIKHSLSEGTASNGPMSQSDLETRLEGDARNYAKIGDVARFVESDMAFPKDANEYVKFGGYSVLLVVAISHEPDELPLRLVYFRSGGHDMPLHRVYRVSGETPEASATRAVFGRYRDYAFFLVPVGQAIGEHDLMCDFASHRSGFVVANAPEDPPEYLTPELYGHTEAAPSKARLRDFIKREWPNIASGVSEEAIE